MTLEEAIKHAEEVAVEQDKLRKRYDDASGYSRSHIESLRVTDSKKCEKCADEHRQLAKWLIDYQGLLKAIDEIKAEIDENIQDCQLPQGHDLWWNGRKDGLIDALVIINEHIERMIQNDNER